MKGLLLFTLMSLFVASGHGKDWWRTMSLYQIYPRSFKDSDGDGIGDLKGITQNMKHLLEANVDAFWVSPIYPSPMVDFGYDIANFTGIAPIFGTIKDFEDMVKEAHRLNLKVLMDFVPNHSSDQHIWFQKSLQGIEPYKDYYVWKEGKKLPNGTIVPPNNWLSLFKGSAWTWRPERQAFYFHQYTKEQPDLNYYNPKVVEEMNNVVRFWLDKGVDGFRVDAAARIIEDSRFLDEPVSGLTNDPEEFKYTKKIYTESQPGTYKIVKGWTDILAEYSEKVMLIEAYTTFEHTLEYYDYGATPFNFALIVGLNNQSTAQDFKNQIDKWVTRMPKGSAANWVAGNHDNPRMVTRFGAEKARSITAMTLLLPGIGVTYNGDEIGMSDTWISWKDTQDPEGCNAGEDKYEQVTRDPSRTPFQWDASTSAGFSTNPKTWLPVNANYKTENLENEKKQPDSYFNFYKKLSALKRTRVLQEGNLKTSVVGSNVLVISRETPNSGAVYALLNIGNSKETVNLSSVVKGPCQLKVYYATADFKLSAGTSVSCSTKNFQIPPYGLVVFTRS